MRTNLLGEKILVGIDFSECSERALLRAIARAEAEQSQLELVHVFEWSRGSSDPEREVVAQARIALHRLAQLCSGFVGDRVPAEIRVVIGEPADGLLTTATEISASLIVLGALGRRTLPRGTVGSTAEGVCERSALPVLLVPHFERPEGRASQLRFVSARDKLLWSCTRCGSVPPPSAPVNHCEICADPAATWISMPTQRASFASLQ